jgi:2-polyprenyl-3-methyl-5-hydroxy-6-metoxy-1,4-benzoquinol methylase
MIAHAYFNQFESPKYNCKNPLQRWLISCFVSRIQSLLHAASPIHDILEIGVGEGFLAGYLSAQFPNVRYSGVDISSDDLQRLRRLFPHVQVWLGTIYDLALQPGQHDTILCCEVLEHLGDPERAIQEIVRLQPQRVIISVPHEPWFMLSNLMRGKNLSRCGNDVEHIQHWNLRTFRKLLNRYFSIQRLTTSYPWMLTLLAPR